MAAELQLSLLGQLQINQDGKLVTDLVSTKGQALLCYLAVTGSPQAREHLAGLFWAERSDQEAKSNLRQALANLRKLFGPYLIITRDTVEFDRGSPYWLDVELFEALMAASTPQKGLQLSGQAVELYRGDFLAGFFVRDAPEFEAWQSGQRERLRQLAIQGFHHLSRQHTEQGEHAIAIDYTTRLLALEPWHEASHRQMMILLANSGQRSAALAQYDTCRSILAKELGVEPALETQALYERLRARETPRPHNLPPQPTPFVGREKELAQLARYLEQPTCRLITLVGLGGVGKTRLALQAAGDNLSLFPDGVFVVGLAAVTSPEGLVAHIASAINLNLSGPLEPKRQLLNYLRSKALLLLLDNFEYLLPDLLSTEQSGQDGVSFLADLLPAAPQVKIVVTSRERLQLQEEWVLEITGLEYPQEERRLDKEQDLPFQPADLPAFQLSSQYSAIALFVQQAQRVQANFTLSAANQTDVVQLCQLLDGMPLGLELAASWLPVLSCSEIVKEIKGDLDFLTTSLWNVPERHRSMRAIFESSWSLLSETERNVLKRLSVFRGGFRRDAAAQVAGATLPVLFGLLSKALLRRDATGRYDMHELLRQYTAEKLAQSPQDRVQTEERHCAYFAEFMEQRDKRLYSPQQLEIIREIELDQENIQAAWQRAVEQAQIKTISQCLWGLWFFYEVSNRFHEGQQLFANAAARLADSSLESEPKRVYALLLAFQGRLYFRRTTDFELATKILQQSLSLLRQVHEGRGEAFVLITLGADAWIQGEYTAAKAYLEQSAAIAETNGVPLIAAFARAILGRVAHSLGHYAEAERLISQSLPVLREQGRLWGLGINLNYLSGVVLVLGRPAEARQLIEESLAVSQAVGDRWTTALGLSYLGRVLHSLGEAERQEAKQLQRQSAEMYREIGNPWGQATALQQLGEVCSALGEFSEAQQHTYEALQVAAGNGIAPLALSVLVSLAELWLTTGSDQALPVEWLAVALNHPASDQATKDRATRLLAQIEAILPRPVLETALAHGQAKTLDAVVAELISQYNNGFKDLSG